MGILIWTCIFLILMISINVKKTYNYDFNQSSLINFWEGFHTLNASYPESEFVIHKKGGYDGQFFFMNAKYIYSKNIPFPNLDSFDLRFSRIGLSLIVGFFCFLTSFQYYALICLIVLISFHLASFFMLYSHLDEKTRHFSLIYLFSPFSLNSIFLLVSDSLLISLVIILFFLFRENKTGMLQLTSMFLLTLLILLTKEVGLFFILSFIIISIKEKRYVGLFFLLFAIFCFIGFKVYIYRIRDEFLGTNPLTIIQLTDFPFFGFFKSFFNSEFNSFKIIMKEFLKIIIFSMTISLCLILFNFKKKVGFFYIPIFFSVLTIALAEVGYWLNFDNISRMLTAIVGWLLLLKNEDKEFKDFYFFRGVYLILFFMLLKYFFSSPLVDYYIFKS